MHTFPWGDAAFTCGLANFRQYGGQYCVGDTSAVGSYPAGGSPYGVMDMAGNVSEWVNDWYDPTYYAASPGSNPPGPADGTEKVLRGSTWIDYGHTLRVALRASYPPAVRTYNLGFRCAAAP
jgi:formylglycine-generating enzyme required for sulfatase activity